MAGRNGNHRNFFQVYLLDGGSQRSVHIVINGGTAGLLVGFSGEHIADAQHTGALFRLHYHTAIADALVGILVDEGGVLFQINLLHLDFGVGLCQLIGKGKQGGIGIAIACCIVHPAVGEHQIQGGVIVDLVFRHIQGFLGKGVHLVGGQVQVHGGEPLGQQGHHHVHQNDHDDKHSSESGGHTAALELAAAGEFFQGTFLLRLFALFLIFFSGLFPVGLGFFLGLRFRLRSSFGGGLLLLHFLQKLLLRGFVLAVHFLLLLSSISCFPDGVL